MFKSLANTFKSSRLVQFSTVFVIALTIWWVSIFVRGLQEGTENDAFTLIYPLISIWGGVTGLVISKRWGGLKSVLGRSIFFLALGLLSQAFGQASYAVLIYIVGIEVPYPSIGDIGYFGSVIFYIIGVSLLARVAGARISLRSFGGKLQAVLIPLALLILSYFFFLRGYEFDWSSPLTVLLDFGYPLGQAFYVALAILTVLLSWKVLGGMMRGPLMFLLLALVIQYFSDYMFLFLVSREQWYVSGPNDYLYLISYFAMTIGLAQLGTMFKRIKQT